MSTTPFVDSLCTTWNKNFRQLLLEGIIDVRTNLVSTYDAVTTCLGEPWRMPTKADIEAMFSNCTISWSKTNSVYGLLVTGRGSYVSKSIFLPVTGGGVDYKIEGINSWGAYWLSTTSIDQYKDASFLSFDYNNFIIQYHPRDFGKAVRPVCNR